jgi:hypothetical protein
MLIDLPEIDWEGKGWTIENQVEKITEEFNEVKEAVELDNPVEIIREALDVMQTCKTLIEMVIVDWETPAGKRMKIEKFLADHKEKLERKEYLRREELES